MFILFYLFFEGGYLFGEDVIVVLELAALSFLNLELFFFGTKRKVHVFQVFFEPPDLILQAFDDQLFRTHCKYRLYFRSHSLNKTSIVFGCRRRLFSLMEI